MIKNKIYITSILCMALLLMSFGGYAQRSSSKKKTSVSRSTKPSMKLDKAYYDFGEIEEGSNGEVVFEVVNEGDGLLMINSVKTSCGCVLAEYSSNGLMHNEKGYIKIRYNTNIVGEIKRSVVVNTNDSKRPKIVLRIIGNVVKKD